MDQTHIMRLPSGFGTRVELLSASYRSQSFTRHTHDTYTLGMVLDGAGTFWCRGTDHLARKGDIVAIPPGEVHTGDVASGADSLAYLAVYLPVRLAVMHSESAGLRGGRPPDFASVLFCDAVVRSAFEALSEAVRAVGVPRHNDLRAKTNVVRPLDEAAVEEAICLAISELIGRHADHHVTADSWQSKRGHAKVSRVANIIRAVLEDSYASADETSLQVLAERAGVTPFRVIRAFREATGLTPHHYLIQVRVERARQALSEGALPSTTALMTGFADQSHLTYHFKRCLGITPTNYQRCVTSR